LKVEKKKSQKVKTDKLRSIGKQSVESVESVLEKKRKGRLRWEERRNNNNHRFYSHYALAGTSS